MKVSYHDQLDRGAIYDKKTRQDNDVIDYTMARYTENDTKLSLLIRSGADYDKNQIR